MSFKVVIPSRFASTRLPGKPLLDIAGKTMVQRVYEQAQKSGADEIVIATDDSRIKSVAESFGAQVVLTRDDHISGTDRIAEVATLKGWDDDSIIVNLQGDEPLMPPELLQQVAEDMKADDTVSIATLCTQIDNQSEFLDPNCVKVVFNERQHALYFSRAPIPFDRDKDQPLYAFRHLGIYAFRVAFLHEFATTPPCKLEELEKLEQLRAMCLGRVISVTVAKTVPAAGVDTQEDLERVINIAILNK